jgi:hypothetical protein
MQTNPNKMIQEEWSSIPTFEGYFCNRQGQIGSRFGSQDIIHSRAINTSRIVYAFIYAVTYKMN